MAREPTVAEWMENAERVMGGQSETQRQRKAREQREAAIDAHRHCPACFCEAQETPETEVQELTRAEVYDMLKETILQRDDPVPLLALLHILRIQA